MAKKTTLLLNILLFAAACGNDKPAPSGTSTAPIQEQAINSEQGMDTMAATAPIDNTSVPEEALLPPDTEEEMKTNAPLRAPAKPPAPGGEVSVAQSGFSDVAALDRSIKMDIRYATADNFTKSKIYDCPRCLLRPAAAKSLVKAHKALQKKGLGLKMFDCYRPRPYQQRLWDKVPNPDYVTPPAKGSMHSRGAAVDLTVVDKEGKELDMGTPYDFFGKEAHTDNMSLPAKVLANRRLLTETLEAVGFKGIRTEWWHFSFSGKNYPLSEYVWPCGEK